MTRIDPAKLESVAILRREGMKPNEIRTALQISRRTYFRRLAEIRRVELEARRLMKAD